MTMSRSEAGKLGSIKAKATVEAQKVARIEKYNLEKKTCTGCQKQLEYEDRHKKFCSQSCSATFFNHKRKKYSYCEHCGGLTKGKPNRAKKFCSVKCQQALIREGNMKSLLAGDKMQLGGAALRRLLIEKFGAKCMECGWDKINPHTGKCPIELEHIDGNSENDVLENLKLLCPSCHSLTATYKALNKGKGRHKRRQRYQEGKSY